jgi:ubiquinol-cytochrome c reductase cytochrome c subunit
VRRRALALVALMCASGALLLWAAPDPSARAAAAPAPAAPADLVARGRLLFVAGCSYCHGMDAAGVAGRGPTLHGVGAAAADFYLATGRMPLSEPNREPSRGRPAYDAAERQAIVAYVGSFGGPGIPAVDPAAGDLREGRSLFAEQCAGCHTITARGGVVPGAIAPALQQATPTQVAEAVRVGPQLMPVFPETQLDQHRLDSVTRYVLSTRHLDDPGGWAIGNLGPVPEGLVAWLLAGTALLIAVRLLGEGLR